jgi:hypothetical protein
LYGPGKANEHTDPHLIAGFADPAELEPELRWNGSWDFRRLVGLLAQPLAALAGPGYAEPVWHCAVRTAPGDRMLSAAEWAQVAAGIMHRSGLAPEKDDLGVRWVAVRHAADHIHIVATLARQDGTRPRIWNDFYRVREACREAETRFGLQATAPADRTAARRATRSETEQAARRGWAEMSRQRLCREVSVAAAGARSEREFFARLTRSGVAVHRRYSATHPGEVTGYAVGLPQHTAKDGGIVWYGGGKLAADLSLPKLRRRWSAPGVDYGAPPGQGLPAAAARAVLRNMVAEAAGEASGEEEFFARLREAGVRVRVRFSEVHPGQVTGYSVSLPGHDGDDGQSLWYGGGRLAANLTLPRLRRRWMPGNGPTEQAGAFRFTAPERDAIYAHTARQAARAAEHIRRCAYTDPAQAADAAWAAADTLHVAARALRNPALRHAADSYSRAARAPYGRIPRPTQDGDRLRTLARLMALAGGPSSIVAAGALVAKLVALAVAVAELREAQLHAAQAAAARSAAEHLHAATVRMRPSAFRPEQHHSAYATRQKTAADLARMDVPIALRLDQVPTAGHTSRHTTSPHPSRQQPRRMGPAP